MIVVLSYDSYEQGTEYVIDWLVHLRANFIKVTIQDIFYPKSDFTVDIHDKKLLYRNKDITQSVNVFFYRRLFDPFRLLTREDSAIKNQVEQESTAEVNAIINYLFFLFRDKVWLPKPNVHNVNKLVILNHAQESGLLTPRSRIISTKTGLIEFVDSCKNGVITKPVVRSAYYIVGEKTYFVHVNQIEKDNISDFPDLFFPSLFQEKIEKEYEIRLFYLDGEFYCLAAITKENTGFVDIKLDNSTGKNQWTIYRLPLLIQKKISKFMKSIDLNTGSIDLIRSKKGDYYFLEVNPVGQYGHTSYFGNFNLEQKIAEWLIKKDRYGN